MHKAEGSDFHQAIREDVLQEPADKLKHVEVGGTLPSASWSAVGESDGEECGVARHSVGTDRNCVRNVRCGNRGLR